ncbi:ATP-binding protein [Bordetella hinzii]|uniref:ATP-binding protein n=1 Tax=Bordetella hinzii TaxID=103855 RepID=UPI003F1BE6B0
MLTQSHPLGDAWTNMLARLEDERIMLQRIAAGEPLIEVLEHVLRTVEAQSSVPLRTSILFMDDGGGLRTAAAPSLPPEYLRFIDESLSAPARDPWAEAGRRGEAVYVADIARDPAWVWGRDKAQTLGMRACWSTPIRRPDGQLLGVFCNHYAEPRLPTPHDIEAIALVTRTAALAIERHRTEQALRHSAQRWRSMFDGMQEGFFLAEAIRDDRGAIRDFRLLEVNPAFELQCGRQAGACLGRSLREMLGQAPPRMMEVLAQVMDTGEAAQIEYGMPPSACYEVRARKESADRVTAMLLDVSARKLAETELWDEQRHKSFQLALGDRLRLLETPAMIEQTTCEALGRHLGLSQVCLLRSGHEGESVRMMAGWSASGEMAPPSRAVRAAVRRAIQRERSLPVPHLPGAAQEGLVVPLGRWGRPESALLVRAAGPQGLPAADQACVEEVAERLCDATERSAHALQLQERVEQASAERDRIWRLSPEVLAIMDGRGRLLSVSPAVRSMLGWSPEQFVAMGFSTLLHPDDRHSTRARLAQALAGEGQHHMENRLRKRDGGYCCITWTMSPAQGDLYLAGRDDTHLKAQAEALQEAEHALRQAQKLEAVGRMTGGIAHDFNNMLQGISGALYLVERRLDGGDLAGMRRYLRMASEACQRAGQLTQRLLTFSRRQPIDPRPCDAGDMLRSMSELFRRYTGERIVLDFDLAPDIGTVRCDANQFESAVLNLVINACDAMPEGGRLVLSTRNVELDAGCLRRFPEAVPGEFVEVAVSDTGCGMAPDVLAHVFEPFFTTKPVGAGTGLGLSTSYGFAQQAGGALTIESQPGAGTTVRLCLPRYRGRWLAQQQALAPSAAAMRTTGPRAVVLLVEDDASVREMVRETVAGLDLTVLCAADGQDGARQLDAAARLDLLITDIGLPGLDGRELAGRARRARPELPVLLMTGYAQGGSQDVSSLGPPVDLILKPFGLDALADRVRSLLAETAGCIMDKQM